MAKPSTTADIVALSTGGLVLAALAAGMFSDNVVISALPLGGHQDLLLGMLGLSLILGAVVRCFKSDRRIMTVKLHHAEVPDRVWRTIFVTPQDMQDWLGKDHQGADSPQQALAGAPRATGTPYQAAPLGDGPVVG